MKSSMKPSRLMENVADLERMTGECMEIKNDIFGALSMLEELSGMGEIIGRLRSRAEEVGGEARVLKQSYEAMEESVFQYIHTEEKVLDRAEETYSLIKKYAATDAAL